MLEISESLDNIKIINKERLLISVFITLVSSFMLLDIIDDWYEGISLYHILPEIFVMIFGMGTVGYLFVRYAKSRHKVLYETRTELVEAKKLASDWQKQAAKFREGLSKAIDTQLELWSLTHAERDVAYLLLKGFSLQEIANLRQTSEKTVRQQSSVIYKKSGLSGRIELSAFFLEDLLAPLDC